MVLLQQYLSYILINSTSKTEDGCLPAECMGILVQILHMFVSSLSEICPFKMEKPQGSRVSRAVLEARAVEHR